MNPSVLIRTWLRTTSQAEAQVEVELPLIGFSPSGENLSNQHQQYQYYQEEDFNMKTYHYNWLSKYPQLSPAWLKACLSYGFHIHHIDGNHNNDHPKNLALVYGPDHLSAHRLFPLKGKNRLWYGEIFTVVFIVLYFMLRWL